MHLNLSTGLISQWERGEKHPAGASLKLLTLVQEKGLDAIACFVPAKFLASKGVVIPPNDPTVLVCLPVFFRLLVLA